MQESWPHPSSATVLGRCDPTLHLGKAEQCWWYGYWRSGGVPNSGSTQTQIQNSELGPCNIYPICELLEQEKEQVLQIQN